MKTHKTRAAWRALAGTGRSALGVKEREPREPNPDRWRRVLLATVVSIMLVLGVTSTGLQVRSKAKDDAQVRSDNINACATGLRSIYVDRPSNNVRAKTTRLSEIQAAGLEAVPSIDGRSATSSTEHPNEFDGLSLEALRPLSAQARVELREAQREDDRLSTIHAELATLRKDDPDKFLRECERLTR